MRFEERLQKLQDLDGQEHIKHKETLKYTKWRMFGSYLIIRTYDHYYTVHAMGDLDHYEVKKCRYRNVNYELKGLKFLGHILDDKVNNENL